MRNCLSASREALRLRPSSAALNASSIVTRSVLQTPAHNWRYGQQEVNVLLLAMLWRGIDIPLLFELMPHRGSSDTNLRHTLVDDALRLLKLSEIQVLCADREFLGHVWIQCLARRGIPIYVRLRLDTLVDEWSARD